MQPTFRTRRARSPCSRTGRVLVGGQTVVALPGGQAVLLRLNPDGSLDQTFGSGGRVISSIQLRIGGIVIQPDGKILTAGGMAGQGPQISFAVSRYNPHGSLDQTFGSGGYATLGPQSEPVTFSDSQALLLQPDGKIVAAGFAQLYPSGKGFIVARFNPDGSRDQSFGSGGSVFTLFIGDSEAQAVALQTDGKIVATGYITTGGPGRNFALARYNANGSIDPDFGIEGMVTTNFAFRNYAMAEGVVILSDGKIIAAGGFTQQNDGFLLARYNTDGRLDQSFGTSGKVMTSFGDGFGRGHANAVLLQSDGKLLVAGSTTFGNVSWETDFVTARYNTNGTFDQTFGNNGLVVSNFSAGIEEAIAIAFQPDGKLVAAGYSSEPSASYTDFALARYLLAPSHRTQFDFDGDSKADLSVYRNGTWYLDRSTAGFFGFQFGLGSDRVVPADYDGDGKTDIAVFRPAEGNWYCFNSGSGTYSALHFGLDGDIPVVGDYDADGRADYAVFRGGAWYIQRSTAGFTGAQFGLSTDRPVAADYDGDGRTDIAVYRDGVWYIDRSALGLAVMQFGSSGDRAVPADYDADGKTDIAVWRPDGGAWYVFQSATGSVRGFVLGSTGDTPVPGDYDGDGKADLAVYRGSGQWWIWQSQESGYRVQNFGLAGDVPVPSAYVR